MEFTVGYSLSKGGESAFVIGHYDGGMAKVPQAAPLVVASFMEHGLSKVAAEEYKEVSEAIASSEQNGSVRDALIHNSQ